MLDTSLPATQLEVSHLSRLTHLLTHPAPCCTPSPPQPAILEAAGTSFEALQALDTNPTSPAAVSLTIKVVAADNAISSNDCIKANNNKATLSLEEEMMECVDKLASSSAKDNSSTPPPLNNLLVVAAGDKEEGKTVKAGEESGPASPTTPQDRAPLADNKGKSPRASTASELAVETKTNSGPEVSHSSSCHSCWLPV
jgi:hypothetical protein